MENIEQSNDDNLLQDFRELIHYVSLDILNESVMKDIEDLKNKIEDSVVDMSQSTTRVKVAGEYIEKLEKKLKVSVEKLPQHTSEIKDEINKISTIGLGGIKETINKNKVEIMTSQEENYGIFFENLRKNTMDLDRVITRKCEELYSLAENNKAETDKTLKFIKTLTIINTVALVIILGHIF